MKFDEAKLYHFVKEFDSWLLNNGGMLEVHNPECEFRKAEEEGLDSASPFDCECGLKSVELAFSMLYLMFEQVQQ